MITFKSIIVMTDFSRDADLAIETAADLAAKYEAKLTVLHVAHDESTFSLAITDGEYKQLRNSIDKEVEKQFTEMENRVPVLSDIEYRRVLRRGTPYVEGLIEMDKKDAYDLVVIGTHGRSGIKHFFLGSTAEKVARRSPIPVMITRLD